MNLHYDGRFYKVIKVRSRGDNSYTFECKTNMVAGYPENLGKELRTQRKLKTIGYFEV